MRAHNTSTPFALAAILSIILLSASAHAEVIINKYTNDFSASTPNNEQIKLCACGTKVDRIIVHNTGNFVADFNVQARSQYPNIRIPGAGFQLAPGHFEEVLIYIEDSCTLLGQYDYDIIVTNSYGRTQRIARTMRVDACQTTSLDVTPQSATVGLCKPATFSVNVTNVGTYADSFRLDFGQYNDAAQLPQRGVYLTPGQSFVQNVSFTFPCTQYGTFDIPFIVRTDKAGPGAETARQVTVTNQYNFALDLPSDVNVCAQTTTSIPVTLRNLADAPEDIALQSTSGLLEVPADIHLEPLQEKNITLVFSPQAPTSEEVSIIATDIHGGVRKERTVTFTADNCYAVSAEVRDTPTNAISAPAQACCGQKTFYVNVQNLGDRRQTFQIAVDGPSFFTLDETTVQLEPTQNVNVPLRATLPCVDETYDAGIIVTPVGQPQVQATARLTVESQTQRTCHMVQIDDDELTVTPEATMVPLTVRHTGSAAGNYTIITNSTIFTVEEANISLLPGEEQQIHLTPIANLSAQEPGRYIVLPTFTLAEQGIDYNEEVGVELQGKGLFARFADWIRGLFMMSLCQWVVLILLLCIIVVLVALIAIYAGHPLFEEGLEEGTLTVLKSGLLILILLLLLSMLLLEPPSIEQRYERAASDEGSSIEWYQDTQKFIDLQQYFYDPDADIISYTVTQPQDISAAVEGTTLVLTPDPGFAGENTVVINATDARGGMTESPPFTLRVIAERQLTVGQQIQNWCAYIVVLELIILLLLLFLIVLTIKERRATPYSSNVLVVVDKPPRRTSGAPRKRRKAATAARTPAAARASTVPRSRALAPLPVKGRIVGMLPPAPAARGRQVEVAHNTHTVMREYKAGGQTVNIAVGAPMPPPAAVVVPGAKQSEIVYVGSKQGDKVHTPTCIIARRIPKAKRVAFSSKREALNAGLIPCKACRPFEGGI